MGNVGDYLASAFSKDKGDDEEEKGDDSLGSSQVKTKHVKPARPASSRKPKTPADPN